MKSRAENLGPEPQPENSEGHTSVMKGRVLSLTVLSAHKELGTLVLFLQSHPFFCLPSRKKACLHVLFMLFPLPQTLSQPKRIHLYL